VVAAIQGDTTKGLLEEALIVMNNLKRFTVCKLRGHNWSKIPYPTGSDEEAPGTFLRCQRCGKENHNAGALSRGGGGLGPGPSATF
jgi:hypothetical protein